MASCYLEAQVTVAARSQDLKGRLSDNRIVMTVTWNPDSVGVFSEWTTG